MQIERFNAALAAVDRLMGRPPFIHTACTAAALLFSSTHFTMLRSGIGLYGLWPSRETMVSAREKGGAVPDFRPVLSWKTRDRAGQDDPRGKLRGVRLLLPHDASDDPGRPARRIFGRVRPRAGQQGARPGAGTPRAGDRADLHEPLHGGPDGRARGAPGRRGGAPWQVGRRGRSARRQWRNGRARSTTRS